MKHTENLIAVTICLLLIINSKILSQTDSVVLESSNLPIVVINTDGENIHNSYRIIADMGIINNPDGQRNYLSDPFSDYNGKINIEIRGSSTQMFDKKSYGFETQDSNGNNLNVPLLSMPEENDWILYAPYADKTLLRNELPYYLARSLGIYASRTAYCELILNGEYRGLYVLMEKIKQDKNRVDIAKLNPEDTTGNELTGGYIIKSDKPNGNEWQVNVDPLYGFDKSLYQYHDPKDETITPQQKKYIQNFIFEVESTLVSPNYTDTINGYAKYLDVPSFADYFLISEFTKNLDSYRFSFYIYKKKDSNGGKLYAGPLWDYDLAFANYGENAWEEPWKTSEWNANIPAWHRTFWMKRLLNDTNFVNKLKARWNEIRKGVFSNSNIMNFIDQTTTRLKEARIRNFTKWQIIGKYVWPNFFVGPTYEVEITFLKFWITERLNWMDVELYGSPLSAVDDNNQFIKSYELSQNYPNPFNPVTTIRYSIPRMNFTTIKVYNILGKEVVTLVNEEKSAGTYEIKFDASQLASGVYFYRIHSGEFTDNKKLILLK